MMINEGDLKELRAKLNERGMFIRKSRGAWMGGMYLCGSRQSENGFIYPSRWVETAEDVQQYIKDADESKASYAETSDEKG